MKYIVLRVEGSLSFEVPVVFPNCLIHADMAAVVQVVLEEQFKAKVVPVSAGEVSLFDSGECHGKSATLGLSSRMEEDTKLLRLNDYGVGHY